MGGPTGPMLSAQVAAIRNKRIGPEGPPAKAGNLGPGGPPTRSPTPVTPPETSPA
ncbi:DUF6053 domain-containing protein [Lysobacter enzymogenes]|uniref:DUF6053 domain-containing protein n=1 Tax=Lysobacter enzymogenes TaxID=69 RepID=UPI003748539D